MSLSKNKILIIISSLIINIIMIILIFNKIDFSAVTSALEDFSRNQIIFSGFLLFITTIFISPLGTMMIIRCFQNIGYKEALDIKIGSMAVKFVTPYKTGDFSRILYYKNIGLNYSKAASALFFEYFIKFIVPVSFAFGSIIHTYSPDSDYYSLSSFTILIIFLTIFFLSRIFIKLSSVIRHDFYIKTSLAIIVYSLQYLISLLCLYYLLNISDKVSIAFFVLSYSAVDLIEKLPIFATKLGVKEFSLLYILGNYVNGSLLVSAGFILALFSNYLPLFVSIFFTKKYINTLSDASKAS